MILSASNFLCRMVSTMCRPRPLRTSHHLVRALDSIRAKARSVRTVDVGAIASTDVSAGADIATLTVSDDGGDDSDPDPDSDRGCHLAARPAPAMRICATLCAGGAV